VLANKNRVRFVNKNFFPYVIKRPSLMAFLKICGGLFLFHCRLIVIPRTVRLFVNIITRSKEPLLKWMGLYGSPPYFVKRKYVF
jgi:hypothetical protein